MVLPVLSFLIVYIVFYKKDVSTIERTGVEANTYSFFILVDLLDNPSRVRDVVRLSADGAVLNRLAFL